MTNTSTQEFVITREFKAPRALVFQVWSDVNHLKNWISPKGTTVEYIKSDIRPGGTAFYKMNTQGGAMYGKVEYKEITPISKLVYMQYFSNEKEEITRHPMSATWPQAMQTTVVFEDKGANTLLTLTWTPVGANAEEMKTFVDAMAGMNQGWSGSFAQLDQYLQANTSEERK